MKYGRERGGGGGVGRGWVGGHFKCSCPILWRLWLNATSSFLLLLLLHSVPPEDVNVAAVVAAVVVVALVVAVCGCGGFLLHRNGFFSREFPFYLFFPSLNHQKIQLFFFKKKGCLTEFFLFFLPLFLFFLFFHFFFLYCLSFFLLSLL